MHAKVIGIDIGGTKMAIAAVDASGRVVQRMVLPTEAALGFERAVGRLGDSIDALLAATGWARSEMVGIGIGCAGPLDPIRGLINNPHTLTGWDQCDIVTPLRERFGVPVYLENDADAAALGECAYGAGQGVDPVVMLTFGTGLGGAIVRDGQIVRGVKGEHPSWGTSRSPTPVPNAIVAFAAVWNRSLPERPSAPRVGPPAFRTRALFSPQRGPAIPQRVRSWTGRPPLPQTRHGFSATRFCRNAFCLAGASWKTISFYSPGPWAPAS